MYKCKKCKGTSPHDNECVNPECPNQPCCNKPRELCVCNESFAYSGKFAQAIPMHIKELDKHPKGVDNCRCPQCDKHTLSGIPCDVVGQSPAVQGKYGEGFNWTELIQCHHCGARFTITNGC